jgi:hypothetical protein
MTDTKPSGRQQAGGHPSGLRPEIARIVEELARAAVRREDRQAREAARGEPAADRAKED